MSFNSIMRSRANVPYRWDPIRRGDDVPEGAVHAGRTATDGLVFVALTQDGDCGKLNTDMMGGKAMNIWASSSDGPDHEGFVLVKKDGAIAAWRSVCRGQKLPDRAVFAGQRFGDGDGPMYVARNGNESGRLLLECDEDGSVRDGSVREIQCHHKGIQEDGEVLIFDPSLLAEQDLTEPEKGEMPKWRARWMWNDSGIPPSLVPGPLRRLSRQAPALNPFRWSGWQDVPSTIQDLEAYKGTRDACRPVRIETAMGICDVYESTADLVLTLVKILKGEPPGT